MKFRPLLSLPLLAKELSDFSGRWQTYLMRMMYSVVLALVALLAWRELAVSLLGSGSTILLILAGVQQVGMQIVLPVLTCGVFTVEKERNTLGLLFLTRLRPWTILLEKFFSRLLVAWGFLLISLPLLAFCSALGGVTVGSLLAQVANLMVAALAIVAGSILCSAYFRTTSVALVASVLLMYGSRLLLQYELIDALLYGSRYSPLVSDIFWRGGISESAMEASLTYSRLTGNATVHPLLNTFLLNLPWLLYSCVCLLLSRYVLVTRAFLPLRTRQQSWSHWFNRMWEVANCNRITRGVSLPRLFDRALDTRPVAWRELISPGCLGSWTSRFRLFLFLESIPFLISIFADHRSNDPFWIDDRLLRIEEDLLWVSLLFLASIAGATLVTRERTRQTLDTLLTTPLATRDIIRQKMASVAQLIWMLAIPLFTCTLFRYWEHGDLLSFLAQISMLLVYPWLLAWIGMWYSLNYKNSTAAILRTFGAAFLWCFVPLLVLHLLRGLFPYELGGELLQMLRFVSPLPLFLSEVNRYTIFLPGYAGPVPIERILLNFAIQGCLMFLVRWQCLRRADALLGRIEGRLTKVRVEVVGDTV